MFDRLLATAGVTEELVEGSRFGFLAFHGGSLERMTDVVAAESARRSGASLYAVRQPEDLRWHVPSRLVDPAASPRLAAFLAHVEVAVAVHGYGRRGYFTTLLLGGSNRALAERLHTALAPRLTFDDSPYDLLSALTEIPTELRGLHGDNPVNRVAAGGVQLELPPRVRGLGAYWARRATPAMSPHTEALIDGLAAVAAEW